MTPEILIFLVLSGSLNIILGTILCYKHASDIEHINNVPTAVIVDMPTNHIPRARPLPSPPS
jgi:hypothetical protein